ncbi:MAG: MATE family efflux transporter [Planctomycetota bacterium]
MTTNAREFRAIALLSAPVVITQLSTMMLGVVDNMMLGHVSVEALNASSLGRLWVIGTYLLGMGLVFGIDPFVSQAHGSGDGKGAAMALQRGLVIALLASIPLGWSWFFTEEALVYFGQKADLAQEAERYALSQLPGLPFLLAFNALRQYLQGRGIMRPAMWVALFANAVNASLNGILIFGYAGFPKLGVVGAGIATGVTQIAMFLMLLWIVLTGGLAREAWTPWTREAFRVAGLAKIVRIGSPVALQIGLEVWAFQIVSLWAGKLGDVELAAHTIVLNLASLSFMIPLGISLGTSTRVGNLLGAGEPEAAQRASRVAFCRGAGVMAVCALIFLVGRNLLPQLYTKDAAVLSLAARVLPIAAAFQLFDGLQVVGSGILRGMGRTLPGALINLLGYYALALPFAAWIAFDGGYGLQGLWWGLSLGLAAVAIALIVWVAWRGPRTVTERVRG